MQPTDLRAPDRVRQMFGRVAHRYDLLNHVLSANLDRRWRREAVRALPDGAGRVLDLCGGTGDLTVELVRTGQARWVVCCDFARPMLDIARSKFEKRGLAHRCPILEADGLRLPFRDGTFDAVTVGFGIRNFADLPVGLGEILRVLRPGGRMVVLEFSRPQEGLMSRLYRFYLDRLLPRIGERLSRSGGAYGYLARTIGDFPDAPTLAGRIREAGFAAADWRHLTGGIVAVHTGIKAGTGPSTAQQHQQ